MADPIAWLRPASHGAGRIAFLPFPGLSILSRGNLFIDPDAQDGVIATLKEGGCALFIALTHEGETPDGEFAAMAGALAAAGIDFRSLPVEDFGVLDVEGLRQWQALRPAIVALLGGGKGVAFSCLAGFGRSGMMAAQVLIDLGETPQAAIDAVRTVRPGAIESEAQVDFLLAQRLAAS